MISRNSDKCNTHGDQALRGEPVARRLIAGSGVGPPRRSARAIRLSLVVVAMALWATPAAQQESGSPWIEAGLRPELYNRGLPVSSDFLAYLTTHFPADPRRHAPSPPYPT